MVDLPSSIHIWDDSSDDETCPPSPHPSPKPTMDVHNRTTQYHNVVPPDSPIRIWDDDDSPPPPKLGPSPLRGSSLQEPGAYFQDDTEDVPEFSNLEDMTFSEPFFASTSPTHSQHTTALDYEAMRQETFGKFPCAAEELTN